MVSAVQVGVRRKFKDEWLSKALIYYQIIDKDLYKELEQRYSDEDYFFDVLIKNNYLTQEDIAAFIENALKIPTVDLEKLSIEPAVIKMIPEEVCQKFLLIPIRMEKSQIAVACYNTSNLDAENEIEYLTGKYVKTYFAFKEQIKQKINEYYSPDKIISSFVDQSKGNVDIKVAGDQMGESGAPVVKLVNQILGNSVADGASDIHIEPKEHGVSVRYRIDGVLQNILDVPRSVYSALISRIKIISDLNIAETRKPQDGKAKITIDDSDIDLRISILPTSFGEKVVIRLLDRRNVVVSFEKMGIHGHNKELLQQSFGYKQGMVLVTGPTGSGKSTTLYAAINSIRSTTNNILTIEDPIEYMLDGINQVQVNAKAGITFASALRSFLRQDPDVILVGEIRDKETAEIAIQAALTGHLVLSTLHTNDTFATISRFQDMGVDKNKITESLQAIVAQRLVRRLCTKCKAPVEPDKTDHKLLSLLNKMEYTEPMYQAKGCNDCGFSGYKGRIGVYEILVLTDKLRDLINAGTSLPVIRKMAKENGFRNLFEDGLHLIGQGITDYKEIIRVINPDTDSDAEEAKTTEENTVSMPLPEPEPDLPQTAEPEKVPANAPPVQRQAEQVKDTNDITILITEDSKPTRFMIKKLIEKKTGWKTVEAEDGMIALEKVKSVRPDVILLDIMMPNMDGYEFMQHLRADQDTRDIPVLIFTALEDSDNEVKGLELGADDFLRKPINPKVMIARIKRILDRRVVTKTSKAFEPGERFVPPPSPQVEQPPPVQDMDDEDRDVNFNLV